MRWRWLLPAVVLLVAFHFLPFGGPALNRAFLDAAGRHPFRPSPVPKNSALVLIDESTLAAFPGVRWPFPRSMLAQLIVALHQAGAAHVIVDITFFEGTDDDQDRILATVSTAIPSVILARTAKLPPVFWPETFVHAHPDFFKHPRTGLVDFVPDSDGVVRRYHVPDSLIAPVFDPPSTNPGGLLKWHGGLKEIRDLGPLVVPELSAGQFIQAGLPILQRLLSADPEFEFEPMVRALAAEPPLDGPLAEQVRGRTVFVGASASSTYDLKALPVGEVNPKTGLLDPEPALLLHWTAWTNLVGDGFITEVPEWSGWLTGALIALAIIGVSSRWPGVIAPTGCAVGFAVLFLPSAYAALSAGIFVPPATPVMAAGLTLLGVIAENFWSEQRRKREIQTMFGAYVDPAVVARLVHDPDSIPLGGESREATVFFSDLVGFTDLSEKLKDRPKEMLEVVNAYLEVTSECLHQHGAFVDKYIGDAVMAAFGVPEDLPDHALAACRAALAARDALDGVNDRYANRVGVTLAVRIGLNTGPLLAGSLGSKRKKNYTVMGDTVNLAARLEGANKEFGTDILLGEKTALAVVGRMATRPLTRLRVKGKQEAIEVYELLGLPETLTPGQREFLAAYLPAYANFTNRRFAAAAVDFRRALTARPDDDVTQELLQQAEAFAATPPPDDWQPILTLKSK